MSEERHTLRKLIKPSEDNRSAITKRIDGIAARPLSEGIEFDYHTFEERYRLRDTFPPQEMRAETRTVDVTGIGDPVIRRRVISFDRAWMPRP